MKKVQDFEEPINQMSFALAVAGNNYAMVHNALLRINGKESLNRDSFDELVDKEIEILAGINVTDEYEDDGPILRAWLNRLLKVRLAFWEDTLKVTEKIGVTEDEMDVTDAYSLCKTRDELEYAMIGIKLLRLRNKLQDLPYFAEYCKRLKELDGTFWWRQK